MSNEQAQVFIQQAIDSLRSNHFEVAAGFARQAIEAEPGNPDAWGALGVALSRMNQRDEAVDALQKAISLSPTSAKGYYNLAAHYYSIGKRTDALAMAREALRFESNYASAMELVRRIEMELGTTATAPASQLQQTTHETAADVTQNPPSPYVRPQTAYSYGPGAYAPRPLHVLKWVEQMGATWPVIGWLLFVLSMGLDIYAGVQQMAVLNNVGAASSTDPLVMLQTFEDMFGFLVFYMISRLLLASWWIIDIVDRRPTAGILTTGIVGIVSTFCCACIALICFPVYAITSRTNPPA